MSAVPMMSHALHCRARRNTIERERALPKTMKRDPSPAPHLMRSMSTPTGAALPKVQLAAAAASSSTSPLPSSSSSSTASTPTTAKPRFEFLTLKAPVLVKAAASMLQGN